MVEPESETVVEVSDPESGLYGARVFVPAGAVSGEGVLFIDEAVSPVGFPAEYREIGPAVGVNLQGATLRAPVEVTAPFSGSLLEFFRSRPGRVSLFIKEDGAAAWQQVANSSAISDRLVSGWTNRLSMFQAGIPGPGFTLERLVGVDPPVVEQGDWCGTDAEGNCDWGASPECICPAGVYGGPITRSVLASPDAVDTYQPPSAGIEALLVVYNEQSGIGGRNAIDYFLALAPYHTNILESHVESGDGGLAWNFMFTALSLAKEMDPQSGEEVLRLYYAKTKILTPPGALPINLGSNIHRYDPQSGEDVIIAGGGNDQGEDVPAADSLINVVNGIAVGGDGTVYFSETKFSDIYSDPNNPLLAHRVRKIYRGADGELYVRTIAGTGEPGFAPDAGDRTPACATDVPLTLPEDSAAGVIAMDAEVLFVADRGNARVRAINVSGPCDGSSGVDAVIGGRDVGPAITIPPGHMVTVLGTGPGREAGCRREPLATYGASGQDTPLSCPAGVAVVKVCDAGGTCSDRYLVASDTDNHQLLALSLEDLSVGRFAGLSGQAGFSSGSLATALLNYPRGLSYNPAADMFFVADAGNRLIRMISFQDPDGDGIGSGTDNCPEVANPGQEDGDADGVGNACDNCVSKPNPDQNDSDSDGLGDACDSDVDNDGIGDGSNTCFGGNSIDCDDNCPLVNNPDQADSDADAVGNACDNCPDVYNFDQRDSDRDGIGDACETDNNGDGIPDDTDGDGVGDDGDGSGVAGDNSCSTGKVTLCDDNCPSSANPLQQDSDGDGIGDACDSCPDAYDPTQADRDYDGVGDACDLCPDTFDPDNTDWVPNGIGDGNGDACSDFDGDGISDLEESQPGGDGFVSDPQETDTDGDGLDDGEEVSPGADGQITDPDDADTDGDGLPDGGDSENNLPPPPMYWILEVNSINLRWKGGDPAVPESGHLNLPPGRHMIGPVIEGQYGGSQYVGGAPGDAADPGQASVTLADYDFKCPPQVWEDECVKDCRWLPSAKPGISPQLSAGEKIGEYWYIGFGMQQKIRGPEDVEKYLVILKTRQENPDCDGGSKEFTFGIIDHIFGNWLRNGSLPGSWNDRDHYTFSVPYIRLQRGERIDGIRLDFIDNRPAPDPYDGAPGQIIVRGSVNLIPIYPEIQDTPSNWLPGARFAGISSSDGNDTIEKKIQLLPEDVGGVAVRARVRVTLSGRTSYTGYAMNASYGNELDIQPDLFAEPVENPDWECEVVGQGPASEMMCEKDMNSQDEPSVLAISSYDFAAYGKIKAEIVKHLDGPNNEMIPFVDARSRGRVENRPGKEYFTTIPQDRGEGGGKKGNKIADGGWMAENAHISDAATGSPSADIDNSPIYGPNGDGLVTLEEYRGFKVRGEHRRTNPFHKDVFISSTLPEDINYASKLPTTNHSIKTDDFSSDHDINWNAGGIAGHRRQCAIIINESLLLNPDTGEPQDIEYEWGRSGQPSNVPGPPCTSYLGVSIFRDQIQRDVARHGGIESELVKYTIGHEAGHCVSFPHRVCMCGGTEYSMMCTSDSIGPDGCLFTNTPDTYSPIDDYHLDLVGQ